nr:hypothetical protein [Chamaesiphon sp. GL140_3_metabinner_50]
MTLVEITDRCNLDCPICYADSGAAAVSDLNDKPRNHRSLAEIELMLDAVVVIPIVFRSELYVNDDKAITSGRGYANVSTAAGERESPSSTRNRCNLARSRSIRDPFSK